MTASIQSLILDHGEEVIIDTSRSIDLLRYFLMHWRCDLSTRCIIVYGSVSLFFFYYFFFSNYAVNVSRTNEHIRT